MTTVLTNPACMPTEAPVRHKGLIFLFFGTIPFKKLVSPPTADSLGRATCRGWGPALRGLLPGAPPAGCQTCTCRNLPRGLEAPASRWTTAHRGASRAQNPNKTQGCPLLPFATFYEMYFFFLFFLVHLKKVQLSLEQVKGAPTAPAVRRASVTTAGLSAYLEFQPPVDP